MSDRFVPFCYIVNSEHGEFQRIVYVASDLAKTMTYFEMLELVTKTVNEDAPIKLEVEN